MNVKASLTWPPTSRRRRLVCAVMGPEMVSTMLPIDASSPSKTKNRRLSKSFGAEAALSCLQVLEKLRRSSTLLI